MLSYRHAFHAGNFGDVVKHVVLVEILDHLSKKAAPFEYIDTHSGTGLYDLRSGDARKLQEHKGGINKIQADEFPELERYFEVVRAYNKPGALDFYPGSPAIARHFLRSQDRAWLFELHPKDFEILCRNMRSGGKIRVSCQDGLKGMNAIVPPASRRALALIDPSYEIKSEYDQVLDVVVKAHKKFSTGIYAVWYPVVDRNRIKKLEKGFVQRGIRNVQRFELGVSADSSGRGMSASGVFVINPPWMLYEKMFAVLPRLACVLGGQDNGCFKCDVICGE